MRALLIVLDNLGVGNAPDDHGAPTPNTLGDLFATVPDLELPTLFSLGLGEILKGRVFDPPARKCAASYGRMIQRSAGADALSGLWELAGAISGCPFAAFEQLPGELPAALSLETGIEFLLNPTRNPLDLTAGAGEGMELRKTHLQTGSPILTFGLGASLHLAAHESVLAPARFAHICRIVRHQCDTWRIPKVTGQAYTGKPDVWKPVRTAVHLPMVPPRTILNAISERGHPVEAVGEIADAFARSGITRAHATAGQDESLDIIERLWNSPQSGMIVSLLSMAGVPCCGHKSGQAAGFARALEAFDQWLERFLNGVESDNLLLISGAPWRAPGPDKPRQEVPVLLRYGGRTEPLGVRETFADVAATLGAFFGIDELSRSWPTGESLITFHRPRGFGGP